MSDKEMLEIYKKLVPFMAELLGGGCEVVLHDTTNKKKSVIAISNSLSGREIGDPLTDLAEKIMEQGSLSNADYLVNYSGKAKGRDFLSSTYLVKNEDRIIGMLCINKDMTTISELRLNIASMLQKFNIASPETSSFLENLDSSVETYVQRNISQAIGFSGITPERMTADEKKKLIKALKKDGILDLKGAVREAASQLNVSVPTIYRYMK